MPKSNVVNARIFGTNHQERRFTAEISDFGSNFEFFPIPGTNRLGLVVVGGPHRAEWVLTGRRTDTEGDVEAWLLEPSEATLKKRRGFAGHTMVIYND